MTKKAAESSPPKNPISRREWVARAIEVARKAIAEQPPTAVKAGRPPRD